MKGRWMTGLFFARGIAVLALASLSGRALAADTITFGHVGAPSGIVWPLYAGMDQGFFAADNITIDVIFTRSSASVMQQIVAGSLDLGDTGIIDPVRAVDQGAAVAILGILAVPSPFALLVKPTIKSFKDLKGKTIAVGDIADIARDYLDRMLVANGMQDSDIEPLSAASTAGRLAALESGAADAAILSAPASFRAESGGFVTLGLAADYVKDFPFGAIVIGRQWAASHVELTKRFLAAYRRSVEWLYDDKNRDAAIKLMVAAAKSDPDDVAKSYDFYRKIGFFERTGKVSKAGLRAVIALLRESGEIKDELPVEKLIMPGLAQFASE